MLKILDFKGLIDIIEYLIILDEHQIFWRIGVVLNNYLFSIQLLLLLIVAIFVSTSDTINILSIIEYGMF
jgi:hypothetical protein